MNKLSKQEFYRLTNEERIAINKKERIGEIRQNNSGESMKIIDYVDAKHILVQFDNGHTQWAGYESFIRGTIRNTSRPSSYGVAYCNIPKGAHKYVKEHEFWRSMLRRCYSEKWKEEHTSYQDVTCSSEWLYFDAFVDWLHSQDNWEYVIDSDERFHLDKDILVKNNKIYSQDACCLVPHRVNALFVRHSEARGINPIGVYYRRGRYESHCNISKGKSIVHTFSSAIEAFNQYKKDKEDLIKHIAEAEYSKGSITQSCYLAMINYEVEITD